MNFFEFVEKYGTEVNKEDGEHLFRQGDYDGSMYIIQEGMLKAYYVTAEGKESVKSFLIEGDVIGSMSAAYARLQNTFSLITLTPCKLTKFDFQTLHQQTQNDIELSQNVIEILLKFAMKKEQRERDLLCLSAQERYENLLESAPDLIERVTQNDIARYLGVTPVGLSRIKQRVLGH
ncbi:Crp/Fnr family transcriptional regulator [Vibrio nigripulchritudo]|uniref:Crp/Fnr family transcriptional regulator n=1 Tax=Vibrio nigripulchritudo TaxID=28173 RepID=UPI0024937735|nr:Crp/Fnr family transcriptional regulator [Vibrio nigripulchritudo]BDU36951.1 Crp/Fnr family transcriptional regulator [Vibrio nigripulchritudo]BDU42661.1 Crp/Fnr family transcriptional regulator [Vibrio nigripulchritudo]